MIFVNFVSILMHLTLPNQTHSQSQKQMCHKVEPSVRKPSSLFPQLDQVLPQYVGLIRPTI